MTSAHDPSSKPVHKVWAAPAVPLGQSRTARRRGRHSQAIPRAAQTSHVARHQHPREAHLAAQQAAQSPTTSVRKVLTTFGAALLLGLLLGAHGVVHSARGMPDGTERDVTLRVGNAALWVSEHTGLDFPWNAIQSALGRSNQPDTPPLLSLPGTTPGTSLPVADPTGGTPISKPRVRPQPPAVVFRKLTAAHPLRLLITGDSQTEFVGPDLVDQLSKTGVVNASVDIHYGTGLARPDFVDWSVVARQQLASVRPEALVIFMGGNDNQGMTLGDGTVLPAGTPGWVKEYERRAEICMRIWTQNAKRRVYWLSVPPTRDAGWAHDNFLMDTALRQAAARVPGAKYLDILGPITDHGRYTDYVTVNGQPVLVRTTDGFHLTQDGSSIVADEVFRTIKHEWRIRP
jgi:lysophospholipase L1-like esterase